MRRAFVVGLGAAAALAAHQLLKWNRRRLRALRQAGHTKLELLPGERADILCMSPATSTVTLYSGDFAAAAEHLIKRVDEMVAANPWLAAVLDYDAESGELNAYIPPDAASRKLFEVLEGVALSGDYGPLVKSLEPAICVKPSVEAAGTGAPLFSVRLLRDLNAERRFALVVSANHSLVDGHGFYRLYNMLSSEAKVEALDPTRKQELPARMLAAMGDEPSPMTACPPGFLASFVFAQVRSQLFPRTKAIGFDISPEWLAAQKATAAGGGVPFVSTNDCIVSCFLNCLDADCGLMPVNFRGKLDGCEEHCGQLRGPHHLHAARLRDARADPQERRRAGRPSIPPRRRAADGDAHQHSVARRRHRRRDDQLGDVCAAALAPRRHPGAAPAALRLPEGEPGVHHGVDGRLSAGERPRRRDGRRLAAADRRGRRQRDRR